MARFAKFTLNLTPDQETIFDGLQKEFGAMSRAELIRKLAALGLLVKEIREKGQRLQIADEHGNAIETIRLI
jgi:hypothetical protein